MLSFKIPAPRKIQCHEKNHTQRVALRNTIVTDPRFTQTSSKLETQLDMSVELKVSMPETKQAVPDHEEPDPRYQDRLYRKT